MTIQQKILGILGIGIALAAGTTQYDKGGLLYDGISTPKVVEKFAQTDEKIKGKYQLEGATLKIPAVDKNSIAVKLGDSTKAQFEPKLEITRWDNKAKFSIKPKGLELIALKDKDLVFEGDKIKFETPDIEYHFYDAPTSSEEGGYEYEIVIKNKPATSTFYSTIDSTGLEFYKQLPLTQEEIDEGANRPENVVNSYAVYYSENGDYSKLGGYNFRAGKAFHIYRVKAIDADGLELWCDQNIYGNTHEIICDNDWLQNIAKYPVNIDPTFGYGTAGGSTYITAPTLYTYPYVLNGNVTLTKLSFYMLHNGYMTSTFIIYDGSNRIDYSSLQFTTTTNFAEWITSSVALGATISSGTYYMGFFATTSVAGNAYYYDTDATYKNQFQSGVTYVYPPPATWTSTESTQSRKFSIYATYVSSSLASAPNSSLNINNGTVNINNGTLNLR